MTAVAALKAPTMVNGAGTALAMTDGRATSPERTCRTHSAATRAMDRDSVATESSERRNAVGVTGSAKVSATASHSFGLGHAADRRMSAVRTGGTEVDRDDDRAIGLAPFAQPVIHTGADGADVIEDARRLVGVDHCLSQPAALHGVEQNCEALAVVHSGP